MCVYVVPIYAFYHNSSSNKSCFKMTVFFIQRKMTASVKVDEEICTLRTFTKYFFRLENEACSVSTMVQERL